MPASPAANIARVPGSGTAGIFTVRSGKDSSYGSDTPVAVPVLSSDATKSVVKNLKIIVSSTPR